MWRSGVIDWKRRLFKSVISHYISIPVYLYSVTPIEMTDLSSLFFMSHLVRFSIEALTTYQGAKANSPTGGS